MRTARPWGIASLFMAAGLGLAGCQTVATGAEADPANAPAVVEETGDGEPARLSLTAEAVDRLRLETAQVQQGAGGLTIPYSAVVYDADGATWTFVEVEDRVYQRESIAIAAIDGDNVTLSSGPPAGTSVVTVAAAELVGVEAGISGGE